MTKESTFFIYLFERYTEYKNQTSNQILAQWEKLGITQLIYEMYELYHIDLRIEQQSNI